MKFLITLGLALFLLSVEAVVVKYLGFEVTRIDVTVALVTFLALRASTMEGAFASYGIGYLLDLMSGRPTGLYTFLAVLTFLVARLAASLVDVRTRAAFALFVVGADLGHGLLAFFFSWMTSRGGAPAGSLTSLPVQALLTGLAAFALYPLLRRFEGEDRQQAGLLR